MKKIALIFIASFFIIQTIHATTKFTRMPDGNFYIVERDGKQLSLFINEKTILKREFPDIKDFFISSGKKFPHLIIISKDEIMIFKIENGNLYPLNILNLEEDFKIKKPLYPQIVKNVFYNIKGLFSQCKKFEVNLYCISNLKTHFLIEHFITQYYLEPPLSVQTINGEDRGLFVSRYLNRITWKRNPQNSSIMRYFVYRKKKSEPYSSFKKIATLDSETYIYIDREVNKDIYKDYSYGVSCMDVTLSTSPIMADDGMIVEDARKIGELRFEKNN